MLDLVAVCQGGLLIELAPPFLHLHMNVWHGRTPKRNHVKIVKMKYA